MTDSMTLCSAPIRLAIDHAKAAHKALSITFETFDGDERDPWIHLPAHEYDNARNNLMKAIGHLQRSLERVNAKQVATLKWALDATS